MNKIKSFSFVIKLTSNCNLNCNYCYFNSRYNNSSFISNKHNKIGIMNDEILECVVKTLIEVNDSTVHFFWHGGEPLLCGKKMFEKILFFQKKHNSKSKIIMNSVQTNGTLLDEDWVDFLVQNNFKIGVSIDGPEKLHLLNRIPKDLPNNKDKDLYRNTLKAIKLLIEKKAKFGILTVVTDESLNYVEDIFNFYLETGITGMDFLPVTVLDTTGKINSELSIKPNNYSKFLISFYDIWLKSGKLGISIREFDEILKGLNNMTHSLCKYSHRCEQYFTILPDGTISLCDCFPTSDMFTVGSIKDPFGDILKNQNYKDFISNTKIVPKGCKKC